ncbi:MAG: aspartyl protease family protein [Salegentibacter sp.]
MKKLIFSLALLIFSGYLAGQGSFSIENRKDYFKQRFELVSDLVLLPVEVNGVELTFLLDTGINSTLIFSLDSVDSLEIKNASAIYLSGLGAGKPRRAIKSLGNSIRVGDALGTGQTLYILTGEVQGIAQRLGVPVNGIIGYDFFKDFIVSFNYPREFMKVYTPEAYKYRRCRRCVDLPLTFNRNKPYLDAVMEMPGEKEVETNLLVDSGSGDAVWLFQNDEKRIEVPEKSFKDFLGFGISGSVYGDRSRISKLALGKHELKEVTVSFPDTLYLRQMAAFAKRDGSLGAQVLRRFNPVIDYPNKRIRLKPNRYFNDPFEYNMSGVVVEHHGRRLVEDKEMGRDLSFSIEDDDKPGIPVFRSSYRVKFTLAPRYQIAEVRPSSPAAEAGLKKGDVIVTINGRPVHRFSLDKITEMFSSREGRKIKLEIERQGEELEFEFRLRKIL